MQIFHGPHPRGRSITWKPGIRVALTAGLTIAICLIGWRARAQTITTCVNNKNGAVSIISKGSCKKGTTGVVLNPTSIQTLTVQTLNIVDANNHTVATLGKNANGNLLTFFDSNGKRTLTLGNDADETSAGLETFDGNNIIAGNGNLLTAFDEVNPNDIDIAGGFGGIVTDGSTGLLRVGLWTSSDLSFTFFGASNPNLTQTNLAISQSENFAGYSVFDSNGTKRQSGGITLDGALNTWTANDATGVTRVFAQQANDPNGGNGFALIDQNQALESEIGATDDGSASLFIILDPSGIPRFSAELATGTGPLMETFDGSGKVTGSIPCAPKTCNGLGFNCGLASDGCGGTISCGSCSSGMTCGGGGTPNVCGG